MRAFRVVQISDTTWVDTNHGRVGRVSRCWLSAAACCVALCSLAGVIEMIVTTL